jgi:hypothetical protein
MFRITVLSLFFLLSLRSAGQDHSREYLRQLLKERKDRFEEFTEAADKKSGIFGNRTKRDVEKQNEVLIEIVRTDNHIVRELEASLNQKRTENYTVYQELNTREQDREKLLKAVEALNAKVESLEKGNASLRAASGIYKVLTWLFGIILVILFIKNKKNKGSQFVS